MLTDKPQIFMLKKIKRSTMAKQKIYIVREQIYWAYANLAMAHTAVDKKQNNMTDLII